MNLSGKELVDFWGDFTIVRGKKAGHCISQFDSQITPFILKGFVRPFLSIIAVGIRIKGPVAASWERLGVLGSAGVSPAFI